MYKRCLEDIDEGGPSPTAYNIKTTIGMPNKTDPTFWQSPAFSLRSLIDLPNNVTSPGPVYKLDNITRYGHDTSAKYAFGKKLNSKDTVKSPGPAAYLPCYPNLKRAPTPKILLPLKEDKPSTFPAPNAYMVRKDDNVTSSIKSRRKGYTISNKWKTAYKWDMGAISPGPAAYDVVNTAVYKNRGPVVSFGVVLARGNDATRRLTAAEDGRDNITRAAECVKTCRKNFTFGVKHSPKCPPYIVPADNSL